MASGTGQQEPAPRDRAAEAPYEAPTVEDLDTARGPAVTPALVSSGPTATSELAPRNV